MKVARILGKGKVLRKIEVKEESGDCGSDTSRGVSITPQPTRYTRTNSPTFTISTTSRFESGLFEKFKSKIHPDMSFYFKSRRQFTISKPSIRSNKNMKPHSPEEKFKKIRSESLKKQCRRLQSQIAKRQIITSKKEKIEKKLEEKYKKYFYRSQKPAKFT